MKATHIRARLRLVGGHVEARHRQPSARFGGIVVANVLECRHNHMLGGGGHLSHDALLALLVGGIVKSCGLVLDHAASFSRSLPSASSPFTNQAPTLTSATR